MYTHKRAGIELVLDPHTFYLCVFHTYIFLSILFFFSLYLRRTLSKKDEQKFGDSVENLVWVLGSFFSHMILIVLIHGRKWAI